MDVSVVVLACGAPEYVRECLASIAKHAGVGLELVLVDNGCGPEVGAVLDEAERRSLEFGHSVKRIRFETNVGAVRGRNAAMKLVGSPFTAWADSDCLARTRGWARHLRDYLAAHADVGVVGPKLLFPWPPHPIQCAGCDVTRSGRVLFRGRGERRDEPEFSGERDCPALISACWMMRTDLFGRLGPLDELFSPVQFEDVDFCYRARRAGQRVVYFPRVEMYHFEGTTTEGSGGFGYSSLTARNAVRFKRKWREVIEREGGLDDRLARWRRMERLPLQEIPHPQVVD